LSRAIELSCKVFTYHAAADLARNGGPDLLHEVIRAKSKAIIRRE
jgi:putative NIF3 family GTP cyclohydrolase 1 type 2